MTAGVMDSQQVYQLIQHTPAPTRVILFQIETLNWGKYNMATFQEKIKRKHRSHSDR